MGAFAGILRRSAPIAAAASVVLLGAARAGEGGGNPGAPFRVLPLGLPLGSGYDRAIAAAGDLDGDGTPDLLVGSRTGSGGVAVVLSGADGSFLRTLEGTGNDGDEFGAALAAVGDIDGRGTQDFLVGAPGGRTGIPEISQPTYAMVLAGEDGAVLFDSGPMDPASSYGQSAAGLPDLDGDGVPEFAVGDGSTFSGDPAAISILSGTTGQVLHRFSFDSSNEAGISAVPLADQDGDGRPDLAVGYPGPSGGIEIEPGRISVVSGATFEEIRSIPGLRHGIVFGSRILPLEGPGSPGSSILATGWDRARERSVFLVVDAADGRVLRTVHPEASPAYALPVATIGDQDGDEVREIVTVAYPDDTAQGGGPGGLVRVYSGGTGRLLFSRRGWDYDHLWASVAVPGDMDGDGREDLALGARVFYEDGEIRIHRVEAEPGARSVRVSLQRPPGTHDTGVRGHLEAGLQGALQPLHIDVRNLPIPYSGEVLLEDGPASGNFISMGDLYPVDLGNVFPFHYGHWLLRLWTFEDAASIRRASLAELAGRRLVIGGIDFPVLQAIIPSPFAADFRGRADLAPPEGTLPPRVRGHVVVSSSVRRGTARLRLSTRGLSRSTDAEAWVEESPGSGTWASAGPLVRGRLHLDTGRGDPLPGAAPDGETLSGRAIEIRDGDGIVLRGTLP